MNTCQDIANEIQSIQSITIDGHKFNIQFFLGADMKYFKICKCQVLLYMVQVPS